MTPQLHSPAAASRSLPLPPLVDHRAIAALKRAGYAIYQGNGCEVRPVGMPLPPTSCVENRTDFEPDLVGFWWTDASCSVGPTVATEEEAWHSALMREIEDGEVLHA